MASVQERLQINRTPLDKWSTREQLCLASTVSSSGDGCSGNWMSVSRTLKLLCGNSKDPLQSRPSDWFSQKNCAVQYGHLLEDVETPKRKKRSSESGNASPAPEPPPEAVVRRLTEERMQEIKLELRREQEEYAKICSEIKAIQSGSLSDEQLIQMWADIEKEQEMSRIEEMRLENQMRERELRKQEMQRTWRTGGTIPSNSSSSSSLKSSTDTTAIDMDVEEIIGSAKPLTSTANSSQVPGGTSPLLSSLLKSPTPGTPSSSTIASSARATAPTITTLLTGGSIPNSNQPAIIPSRDDAIQMLTRPLSGPPTDTTASPGSVQLSLLSPSQSAPTLSMLLEKNKSSSLSVTESKLTDLSDNTLKNTDTRLANDSNNESIPMDIEEDLPTTNVGQNLDLQSGDIDDTDPNEEQQLLEVFKNIGNIDELDIDVSAVIDEEVDFLKGVDEEETPIEESEEFVGSLEKNMTTEPDKKAQNFQSSENDTNNDESDIPVQSQEGYKEANTEAKVEMMSSDDSNDNLPLAAVASLESSKDRLNESSNESSFLKEEAESICPKNEPDQVDLENESTAVAIKQEMLDEFEAGNIERDVNELLKEKGILLEDKKSSDVFIVPSMEGGKTGNIIKTDSEESQNCEKDLSEQRDLKSIVEAAEMNVETINLSEQSESIDLQSDLKPEIDLQSEVVTESSSLSMLQPPPAISIADTDENSSSTDISVQTRKDEKLSKGQIQHQRKSPHEAKTDDEMPNPSTQMVVPSSSGNLTPRPTALRKLRDRDRSESPMIDDDATTHSDHSTTTNQRSRRRYSSTPVIDSIPNSPASSDRDETRDLRASKKALLSIYNVLQSSKHACTLQRILTDEQSAGKLEEICLKQVDFVSIKKNIESGSIRTVYELQRDVLLMCQNALMISKTNSIPFKSVLTFQQDCQNIREFMPNYSDPQTKFDRDARDTKSSGSTSSTGGGSTSKGRSGSRKSLRLS